MADGDVDFDDAEIQRILNSAPMRNEIQMVMNLIVARARSTSPIRTGDYISASRTEMHTNRKLRAVGLVINDDPGSAAIESRFGVLTKSRRVR